MSVDDKKIIYSMVKVGKVHGTKQVLRDISLSYFYGAKIGVLGLNGSGKSTLLKIMAGVDKDHRGEAHLSEGYTVGYLEQEPQLEEGKTVKDVVSGGAQDIVDLLKRFDEINARFGEELSPDEMDKVIADQAKVQDKLDAMNAWELDDKLNFAMEALRCPPADELVDHLSGGERRRVALCRLLIQEPDILLLDEPTNHLDIKSREVLLEALKNFEGTIILVSHDRHFLRELAEKVYEVDKNQVQIYPGNYDYYLSKKR